MCAFSPHPSTPPQLNPPPSPIPPPPWFGPCVLYSSSCNPLSSLSPPHSPLPIVRLFLTSMSLVIFCFLFSSIYYVPVKGEIIWYLSLSGWLISLNIMLSSSIHSIRDLNPLHFPFNSDALLMRIPRLPSLQLQKILNEYYFCIVLMFGSLGFTLFRTGSIFWWIYLSKRKKSHVFKDKNEKRQCFCRLGVFPLVY